MTPVRRFLIPTRASRALAVAITTFSLSACDLGWDCGTRNRTVAKGTVRDAAGATLATAEVDLSDNVGPSFLRLSAGIMGPAGSAGAPLRGHVTRARLVDEAGELIAEIPTSTATLYIDAVVALNVDLSSQAEYSRVRSALLTTRAKIILETDVAGLAVLETILSDARDEEGKLQRCRPA